MGIILLGYRGSGKTTVARLIADRLSCPMSDTDQAIVAAANCSIREIFERFGEQRFRDLETDCLEAAVDKSDIVISLGGGAILRDANRAMLCQSSHRRFYLRCDAKELHRRIHADPSTADSRPSLTHLGGNLAEIEHLLEQREPLYREVMTAEIDVTSLSAAEVADAILDAHRAATPRRSRRMP